MTGFLRMTIAAAWLLLVLSPGIAGEPGYRIGIMSKLVGIDYCDAGQVGIACTSEKTP